MRIERFDALDASRGMREINARYGDDVLIIASSRVAGKIQFVIAIDTEQRSRRLFTPELLVRDFGGATAASAATMSKGEGETIPDAKPSPELAALISAGFNELKVRLDEIKQQQSRPPRHVSGHRAGSGELPLQRLMRLMSGCTVPIDLLQTLSDVTSGCAQDIDCIAAVRSWLHTKLRDAPALEKLPNVHFLVGAHGVGKSVLGLRLAATLSGSGMQGNAVFVSYKPGHDGALSVAGAIGQDLDVNTLHASDFSALVSLINEHISSGSLIVELPANLHASEFLRLQQRLPSALFHLVIATDSHVNALQYVTRDKALKFTSALITRIDHQGVSWPTIHTLIENDVPLMWGSHGGSAAQSLVPLDKASIIDDVVRAMSDSTDSYGRVESVRFRPLVALSKNQSNAELM